MKYVRFPLWRWHLSYGLMARSIICGGPTSILPGGDENDRYLRASGDGSLEEQSSREFTSAVPAMCARDGEIQEPEITTEIHFDPIFSPQRFQSGTPSSHLPKLQTQPLGHPYRMASNCRLNSARYGFLCYVSFTLTVPSLKARHAFVMISDFL
jgi:hypothetical protein